jgi:hypothetical protein
MTQTREKTVFAEVTVKLPVTLDRVLCLLCSALEGGSNYWYMIEDYEFPDGVKYADFKEGGKYQIPDDYWHPAQLIPTHPGCSVIFTDNERDDGEKFRLNREALVKGLEVMATKYPRHWTDFMQENDDAETGDVYLQCCLFGEAIYG